MFAPTVPQPDADGQAHSLEQRVRFLDRSCFWCLHRFACGKLASARRRLVACRKQVRLVNYLSPWGKLSDNHRAWRGMELCTMMHTANCENYTLDEVANVERAQYIAAASADKYNCWIGGATPGPPWQSIRCGDQEPKCKTLTKRSGGAS